MTQGGVSSNQETAHLVELESSSVSLLQEKLGFGATLGRHSITTRPFFGARTLFTGLSSNVGAQAEEEGQIYRLFITKRVEYA